MEKYIDQFIESVKRKIRHAGLFCVSTVIILLLAIHIINLTPYAEAADVKKRGYAQKDLSQDCNDLAAKVQGVSVNLNNLSRYDILRSDDFNFNYRNVFSNIRRTNILTINSLCHNKNGALTDKMEFNYQCVIKKIYNSLEHLNSLNNLINSVTNAEEAIRQSKIIKEMIAYYFEEFYVNLDSTCSVPPLPLFEKNMEIFSKKMIDSILSMTDKILLHFPMASPMTIPLSFKKGDIKFVSDLDKEKIFTSIEYYKKNKFDMALYSIDYKKYYDGSSSKLHYILGNIYYLNGDIDNALIEYDKVLAKQPDNYRVIFYKGNILNSIGNKKKAALLYESVIDIVPDFYMAWFRLGNTLYELGNREEAFKNLEAAIRVKNDFYLPWYYLGVLYEDEKRYKEASLCFKEAIGLNPSYVNAYQRLIAVYKKDNELSSLIEEYKLKSKFKNTAIPHIILGTAYMSMGKTDNAKGEFLRSLEIEPNVAAYTYLGLIYQSVGRYRKSIEMFENAVWIDPGFAQGYFNLGVAYEYNERGTRYGPGFNKKRAVTYFEKAIGLNYTFSKAYNKLGLLYLNTGETKKAAIQFKRAIKANPYFVESYNNLIKAYRSLDSGESLFTEEDENRGGAQNIAVINLNGLLYQLQGDFINAEREFKKAIEINSNPVSYNFLGRLFFLRDDLDAAEYEFKRSLSINPLVSETNFNIGLIEYRRKSYDLAISFFEKAAETRQDLAEAYYMSGKAYAAKGNLDKAAYLFDRAFNLNLKMDDALKDMILSFKKAGKLYNHINRYKDIIANSPSVSAYNKLGYAYFLIGRRESALLQFKKAADITPNVLSYYLMGETYNALGEKEKAIIMLTRASVISPNVKSYLLLGQIYEDQNEYKKARRYFKKAMDIDFENIGIRMRYASMFEYNSDGVRYGEGFNHEDAIKEYKKIININPNFVRSYYRIGLIYKNINKSDESIAQMKKIIELNSRFLPALKTLKELYLIKGDKKLSKDIDKRILDLSISSKGGSGVAAASQDSDFFMSDEDIARKYYTLGISSQFKGNIFHAIEQYKKAISKNPNFVEAYYNLGVVYQKKGIWDKAVEIYNRAVSVNPDIAEAYNNLGIIYEYIGEYSNAIAHYKKAIETDIDFLEAYKNLSKVYEKKGYKNKATEVLNKYKVILSSSSVHQ